MCYSHVLTLLYCSAEADHSRDPDNFPPTQALYSPPSSTSSATPCNVNSLAKWQAAKWLSITCCSGGTCSMQICLAYLQRGWKWQPDGGLAGLAISPCAAVVSRGWSGSGRG